MLSERIKKIQPSATLAINARALEMQKKGVDILKFGTGEPDFDTPEHIKNAAKKAIDEGFTKYTAASGMPELKEAVCQKLKRDNDIKCEPKNILISNGGKQALFNFFMAVLDEDDEVIIPSPYWVSYADMVRVCGGNPVFIDTRPDFKLTADMVRQAVTLKTKALILNSPCNPTGMLTEEDEIKKIAKIIDKNGIFVLSDEVYEHFVYDGKKMFSIGSLSRVKDYAVTINAVSKTYAMTGWRVGYAAGPENVIHAMSNLQSHSTSNPCSIAQKAAIEALTGDQSSVIKMTEEFKKRRDYVYEEMNKIPGFELENPEGAFYAFVKVSKAFTDKASDSFLFAEFLLEKARVAVIPGGAFGAEGNEYIRFSYASGMPDIMEGIERILRILS